MRNKLYYDGTVDFHVKINTKLFRWGILLFYTLLLVAGIITLFYTPEQLPNATLLGICIIAASLSGFGLMFYKVPPRIVGILISTAILLRPFALLSRLAYGISFPVVANLSGIILYTAFWVIFYLSWITFIEPFAKYRIGMHKYINGSKHLLEREREIMARKEGLEPPTTAPEAVVLPITPFPKEPTPPQ